MSSDRNYFSQRREGEREGGFDLLHRGFFSIYELFEQTGYFDEAMGFECKTQGETHGTMGHDLELYSLIRLRKDIFPVSRYKKYEESDIFDLIEFLYDHVSKPLESEAHWYDLWEVGCKAECKHWTKFSKEQGQEEFRNKINEFLCIYQQGWELSESGEIISIGDSGMDTLFNEELPVDDSNIKERVEAAITKFRSRKSTTDDQRHAIRDLADALERIRPQVKEALTTKDSADLYEIVNRFGIRHNDMKQQDDYDPEIYLKWLFYYYLAAIHAVVRLIKLQKKDV